MSSKTLVLHVERSRTCGAVIESSIGSMRVASVFETQAPSLPSGPFDRVLATLPSHEAYFRLLPLPFRDRRRAGQAVGPALEEHVPLSLDEGALAWDLVPSPAASTTALAALAPLERIEALAARVAELGLPQRPQRILWAPTLLLAAWRRALGADVTATVVDIGDDGAVVARLEGGAITALRIVAPCSQELLLRNSVWSVATVGAAASRVLVGGPAASALAARLSTWGQGSLAVEELPREAPVEGFGARDWRRDVALAGLLLAAAGDADAPLLDFESASSPLLGLAGLRDLQELRTEAGPLLRWGAAAAALALVAVGLDYVQLFTERSALVDRAEKLYSSAMPSASGGVGRRLKMEMRLRELSGRPASAPAGGSPLALLAALSREVPKNLDVVVDQVDHLPPAARVIGHAASFETVTKMQQALQKSGAFARVDVKDVHAAVSGSGVEFTLELATAEAGA